MDCFPESGATEQQCQARGCCWVPFGAEALEANPVLYGTPWCFFPNTPGYNLGPAVANETSVSQKLTLGSKPGPFGNDINPLQLDVNYDSAERLHFTIQDPSSARYTPPVPLNKATAAPGSFSALYDVKISEPFGVLVTRKSNGQVMFDSRPQQPLNQNGGPGQTNGLVFENQYIEITTRLPAASGPDNAIHIYGLGEHVEHFELPTNSSLFPGSIYTMNAKDQGTPFHSPLGNTNLYASHPLHLVHDPTTGDAFGVFLFNSNAMDITLQPNALTYRITGGVLDFYIFAGPTPADVLRQYHDLIGHAYLPPRWALGFHLCRWGYNSLNGTQAIWQAMLDNNMPQDSQWNDIDYMNQHLDFTTDPVNYPTAQMAAWVDEMHTKYGQQYMMIFDPGISSTQPAGAYPAWDDGVKERVFIMDAANDQPLIGRVWPGLTGFPDFFAPNAQAWWTAQIKAFHEQLPFDGMWIDMNEPSNFCDGSCSSSAGPMTVDEIKAHREKTAKAVEPRAQHTVAPAAKAQHGRSLRAQIQRPAAPETHAAAAAAVVAGPAVPGFSNGFPLDLKYPPYLPGQVGGASLLEQKTVSMDAVQAAGVHYNVHNLYGWGEGRASNAAMESVRGKRAMIISRSTFPSSGTHNGHWLGDNQSTWEDLAISIAGVLNMNILGIPLVGADTCGFGGQATTPELCTRWMQLGAYLYGFYRNHNTIGKQEQAPAVFADPYRSYMRDAMNGRLALLPYLYTQFKTAHAPGSTGIPAVTRAMFLEFPTDPNVTGLDQQAMFGPALLVMPVVTEGATSVSGYFPASNWYDWFSGELVASAAGYQTIDAPLSKIPVFVRGGYIVPTQVPQMTTLYTNQNAYSLNIAPDATGSATGSMYLDDGETIGAFENGQFTEVAWQASVQDSPKGFAFKLAGGPSSPVGYQPPASAGLSSLRILGARSIDTDKVTVVVNGAPASHSLQYDGTTLTVAFEQALSVTAPISVLITASA